MIMHERGSLSCDKCRCWSQRLCIRDREGQAGTQLVGIFCKPTAVLKINAIDFIRRRVRGKKKEKKVPVWTLEPDCPGSSHASTGTMCQLAALQ